MIGNFLITHTVSGMGIKWRRRRGENEERVLRLG
jgi:hypothetical protein